jgi:uncharacterized protein (TIGR02284 family)
MATMTNERELIQLLNGLIELDFDAIEAYKAAVERLVDTSDKAQLGQFLEDHRRHVSDLSSLVSQMNGTPKNHADVKQILTKGKVVLGGLIGDRAILQAMKSNEDDTNRAYEKALGKSIAPAHIREALERNLQDERRHRAWIEQRLVAQQRAAHP